MRTMFIDTLLELADADDRIFLLCGDLGYSVLEPFLSGFPTGLSMWGLPSRI